MTNDELKLHALSAHTLKEACAWQGVVDRTNSKTEIVCSRKQGAVQSKSGLSVGQWLLFLAGNNGI